MAPNLPANAPPRATRSPLACSPLLAGCGGAATSEHAELRARGFDAERAFADLTAQVELGPRPRGSAAAQRAAELIAASGCERAGVSRGRDPAPVRATWSRRSPAASPGTVVVGAHYDTKRASRASSAPTTAPPGVAVLLELARALPAALAGPVGAAGLLRRRGGARRRATSTSDGDPRQPPVRRLRARRRPQGSPPLDADPGDGPVRHGRRLRPADPATRRPPTRASTALFADAADSARRASGAASRATASRSATTTCRSCEAGIPARRPDRLRPTARAAARAPTGTRRRTRSTRSALTSLDAVGEAALVAIPRIR